MATSNRKHPLAAAPEDGSSVSAILAHEIGHVLESVDRHADTGIMRARWTADDLDAIASRSLTFSHEDISSIRKRMLGSGGIQRTFNP